MAVIINKSEPRIAVNLTWFILSPELSRSLVVNVANHRLRSDKTFQAGNPSGSVLTRRSKLRSSTMLVLPEFTTACARRI